MVKSRISLDSPYAAILVDFHVHMQEFQTHLITIGRSVSTAEQYVKSVKSMLKNNDIRDCAVFEEMLSTSAPSAKALKRAARNAYLAYLGPPQPKPHIPPPVDVQQNTKIVTTANKLRKYVLSYFELYEKGIYAETVQEFVQRVLYGKPKEDISTLLVPRMPQEMVVNEQPIVPLAAAPKPTRNVDLVEISPSRLELDALLDQLKTLVKGDSDVNLEDPPTTMLESEEDEELE
jgi:hypothetical protein